MSVPSRADSRFSINCKIQPPFGRRMAVVDFTGEIAYNTIDLIWITIDIMVGFDLWL